MNYEQLQQNIHHTLAGPPLPPQLVIQACGELSRRILQGFYDSHLSKAGIFSAIDREELTAAAGAFSAEALKARMDRELGRHTSAGAVRFPLGVLFHIGAGNTAGLGACSVIEGLLTGNINLLKPAGEDDGISQALLRELVRIEPALKPYIYIFPIPSSHQKTLKRLMKLADGIVVWGGDEAVLAVRALAGPDKRLIEWRNQFSFVYISSPSLWKESTLKALALHLLKTRQRLCSSCQTIFLGEGDVREFARKLDTQISRLSREPLQPLEKTAQNTLRCYTLELMDALQGQEEIRSAGCPIRLLPRASIIPALHSLPSSLMTAGLICQEQERRELTYLLLRSGAVRVCRPEEMSVFPGGEAHDGEYPLLRYTKLTEAETF